MGDPIAQRAVVPEGERAHPARSDTQECRGKEDQ